LVNLGTDERIIFKQILGKVDGRCELDSSDSKWKQVAGCCQYGDEASGSIYCGKLLTGRQLLAAQDCWSKYY
jgi:hypothetical protein